LVGHQITATLDSLATTVACDNTSHLYYLNKTLSLVIIRGAIYADRRRDGTFSTAPWSGLRRNAAKTGSSGPGAKSHSAGL